MIPLLSGTEREDTNERCREQKQTPSLGKPDGSQRNQSGAGRTGGLELASAHGVHGMAGQEEPVVEPREL